MLFDILHLDGEDLLDAPLARRAEALRRGGAEELRVPRVVTADLAEAQAHFDAALAAGHEGVVVKALDAPYAAGRRGASWLKVKPRHTLDLVVLAAEWGHGRRQGWLSNLHLGARATDGDGFVMLGKTFKGLTDELLTWQTEKLQELTVEERGIVVFVRARAGGGDRVRRRPDLAALPRRRRAALRARAALPRGQDRRRGRRPQRGARAAAVTRRPRNRRARF